MFNEVIAIDRAGRKTRPALLCDHDHGDSDAWHMHSQASTLAAQPIEEINY
jgi:hypothetical protein